MNKDQMKTAVRMMVMILNHKDIKKAAAILDQQYIPVQLLTRGEGTASSEILDYLGLGSTDKAIMMSPVLKHQVPEIFKQLTFALNLDRPNRGIAFTFPVSGASQFILKLYDEEVREKIIEQIERSEVQMSNEAKHSLLMVIINQGYSEEVMTAARDAGAAGGTVISAHRLGPEEPMKRWGISIQAEKEMIYILTDREKKHEIMKAIGQKCGLHSDAQGIVLAVPVDAVAGLS